MSETATALVTASAGTIGQAIVERLLAEKIVSRVLAVDRARPAGPHPDGVHAITCDLLDADALTALAAGLDGPLNVLVNVLGGEREPPLSPVADVAWPPDDVVNDIFELNVFAAYRVTRALLAHLAPGSAICNVSSIAADMPWPACPPYGAAKAALEHWTRTLAALQAPRGIRANLVRPGFVWSRQWSQRVTREEFEHVARDRVPLRARQGHPGQDASEVAAAVAYLCSPAAAQTTGQAVDVDGGASLVRAAR